MNLNFNTLWSDATGKVAQVWQKVLVELAADTWTRPDATWRPDVGALNGMTVSGVGFNYGWCSNTDQEVRFSCYVNSLTLGGTPSPYVTLTLPFNGAPGIYQHLHADVFMTGQNWTAGFSYVDLGSKIIVTPTGVGNWPLGPNQQLIVSGSYLRA